MKDSGWNIEYIHTGPVIRRENGFTEYSIDERRSLIYKMFNFVIKCPINFVLLQLKEKKQQKYRLLQAADFFCSIDLLKIKRAEGRLSRSET